MQLSACLSATARAADQLLTVDIATTQLHTGGLHDSAAARRVRRAHGGGQDVQVLRAGGAASSFLLPCLQGTSERCSLVQPVSVEGVDCAAPGPTMALLTGTIFQHVCRWPPILMPRTRSQ